MEPYYVDSHVTLYHGDCREVMPTLGTFDCIVTDPPYGETSLAWDRWPQSWPTMATARTSSMWCFGSLRMFLDRCDEFVFWKMSQDVVWEKHAGSGLMSDRFRRVHELAVHWYLGRWEDVYWEPPRRPSYGPRQADTRHTTPVHAGGNPMKDWVDDGTRLVESVIHCRSMQGRAQHPTEKPVGILDPLIRYACPPGGVVLDPFAGSGSTAESARQSGRRAVLIEADEKYCKVIARRMSQGVLPTT